MPLHLLEDTTSKASLPAACPPRLFHASQRQALVDRFGRKSKVTLPSHGTGNRAALFSGLEPSATITTRMLGLVALDAVRVWVIWGKTP